MHKVWKTLGLLFAVVASLFAALAALFPRSDILDTFSGWLRPAERVRETFCWFKTAWAELRWRARRLGLLVLDVYNDLVNIHSQRLWLTQLFQAAWRSVSSTESVVVSRTHTTQPRFFTSALRHSLVPT